jgi:putative ABC transport system ATP-binding protein
MSTLVAPDEGAVLYNGENVAAMGERGVDRLRRRDFGVVFQFHHLMPTMTALENVLLPFLHRLRPVGASLADRARECLERVGLAHKADCLPAHLSGGEQQRVAIARALVKRSRILFADEPTGSLDSATGDRIMELLCGLNAEGLAVVMVTHNEEYAALARTRLTMRDGMLADAGGTCCAACPA